MDPKAINAELKEKLQKTVDVYERELQSIRAGRANPSLLDRIQVSAYGQMTPLNQVAGISVPEARQLLIQPWDANLIPDIEKAILASDLGLNPSNDGKIVRLIIPQLTEERRKELIKVVGKDEENAKVAVRNLRRDALDQFKKLEKNKEISEDELKSYEEKVQEVIDEYIKKLEAVTAAKEEELLEI